MTYQPRPTVTAAELVEGLPPLLTYREAAQAARVSERTIHRLRAEGTLAAVRIGRATRIPRASLGEFLARSLSA